MRYNAQQVREIFRRIDWRRHLQVDFKARFQQELTAFEKERKTPYVTSIERLAEARGTAAGYTEACLRPLTQMCGDLFEAAEGRVRTLSAVQLQQLDKDLLRFQSLAELERWPEPHAEMGD